MGPEPGGLERELRKLLADAGAALAGFAGLGGLPPGATQGYSGAVAIAVALSPGVVAAILTGPHKSYSDEYAARNAQLDALGLEAEAFIKARGYAALALTRARTPYDKPGYQTALPHKTAARLAGLGWIGKNAALVTPEFGSAVRLVTVLTSAPLAPGPPVDKSRCGGCTACQRACPAGAVKGTEFCPAQAARMPPGEARAQIFDAAACAAMLDVRRRGLPGYSASCGLCIAACPYTVGFLRRAGAV